MIYLCIRGIWYTVNGWCFVDAGEGGLDPIDIAVLDALVTGGAVLSLKAHFIDMMPDISPITNSLRYLNLSFNNFTVSEQLTFILSYDTTYI